MNKHLKTFHELHHKHHLTHRVLSLVIFAIIVMLAVYGLSQVRAEQAAYAPVPNGDPGVCFKVGTNFNNPLNHVSCKSYQQVCQTNMGALVECRTGNLVTE